MRPLPLLATLLAAFLIAGCASTVSPLYTNSDAVADPAIVGTWVGGDKDNQGTVHVSKEDNGSYQVTVHSKDSDDDAVYETHLVKLGSASYADLRLTDYRHAGKHVDLPLGTVSLHEIVKYQVTGDDLAVSVIGGDEFEKAAKQPGFPLQFRDTKEGTGSEAGGDTVILSSTADLRRYFSAHPADIFGEVEDLKRQH